MPRRLTALAILTGLVLLTGCQGTQEDVTSQENSTPLVGDFNFIEQKPVSSSKSDTSGATLSNPAIDTSQGQEQSGMTSPIITPNPQGDTSQGTIQGEVKPVYISPYEDLSTNVSIQIGSDVYVSVPSSVLDKRCGLDAFIETYRRAHTLVNEEDYGSKDVVEATYANGTCLSINNSVLYINGLGIGYWCKCTQGTIEQAYKPTISLFNLGKLKSPSGSMTARYNELGTLIDSEDSELFYRAIYNIKDLEAVANNPITGRAVLIFNKSTGAISTCLIYVNKNYCQDATANADLLAGSVRFSTEPPENLISLH